MNFVTTRRTAAIIVSAAVLVSAAILAQPANAAPRPGGDENGTAELIARVAPREGTPVIGTLSREGMSVPTGAATVHTPPDSTGSVEVLPSAVAKPTFGVRLPSELKLSAGVVGTDGTVVYSSRSGDSSVAVQVLNTGATRMMTIIPSRGANDRFTYGFSDGYSPVQASDGSIVLLGQNAGSVSGFAILAAPWAEDAAGKTVATHYEIQGTTVVQVVQPSAGTVFPVVADPTWTWYSGAYGAKLNRSETHSLASAGGITGMCAALIRIAGEIGAVVCGVYGAYLFAQASIADSQKQCVFVAVVPAPLVYRYKDSSCT